MYQMISQLLVRVQHGVKRAHAAHLLTVIAYLLIPSCSDDEQESMIAAQGQNAKPRTPEKGANTESNISIMDRHNTDQSRVFSSLTCSTGFGTF